MQTVEVHDELEQNSENVERGESENNDDVTSSELNWSHHS